MPPLILLAVTGAGLYAGYKLFSKFIEEARRPGRTDSKAEVRTAQKREAGLKDLGELEWDEKSGAYVPKKNG